ncbi:hypothetical protein BD289DRAFT_201922 [Coniella lustricola]|uniref:Uncharacterized protein n=1 Tax=Coniella lustricola TaxID=2025994 RepID=A0A2T3ACK5_9PEZI|nr:hypothetical protein BD289DRAFT_201922 [Coniella lustricola]
MWRTYMYLGPARSAIFQSHLLLAILAPIYGVLASLVLSTISLPNRSHTKTFGTLQHTHVRSMRTPANVVSPIGLHFGRRCEPVSPGPAWGIVALLERNGYHQGPSNRCGDDARNADQRYLRSIALIQSSQ